MGRGFAEVCRWLKCLPSELYKYHDPTLGDFAFVAAMHKIDVEEQAEMLSGSGSSKGTSSGRGPVRTHIPYRGK